MAIAGGLYISGIWHIERLEAPRVQMRGLGVMLPPPAPSGGSVTIKTPPIDRKRPKPKPPVIVQPEVRNKPDPAPIFDGEPSPHGPGPGDPLPTPCIENCEDGIPSNEPTPSVCGDGARDASEQCDDGNAINGDGCSSTCRTEVKPARPMVVAPNVLSALRISGNTDVHPSSLTQNAMIRADTRSVRAMFLVCVAADGSVARAERRVSTKYPDYDEVLQAAIERWRYRPYTVDGAPVQACSTVEFRYTLR